MDKSHRKAVIALNNTQEKKLYYTVKKSSTELSHITKALRVLKKHRNSSGELVRTSGDKYTVSIENRLSVSLERLIKHYFEKDVYAVLNKDDLEYFKCRYNHAVNTGLETFCFKEREYITSYAKYLLEFIRLKNRA
jgi:hypothetical protein